MVSVQKPIDPWLVLRGPLILASVGGWVLVQLLLFLSWQTIIASSLLGIGLLVTLYDTCGIMLEETRLYLKQTIDGVSLDDILKAVHSAESDCVAVSVGTIVGQLSMYGLPCSTDQKVRLLQSGLEIDSKEEAFKILMQRGGWKEFFLPRSLYAWIYDKPSTKMLLEDGNTTSNKQDESAQRKQQQQQQQTPVKTTNTGAAVLIYSPDSDGDSQNSQLSHADDATDIFELEKDRIRARQLFVGEVSSRIGVQPRDDSTDFSPRPKQPSQPTRSLSPESTVPLPVDVFGSVLKEMLLDSIRPYIAPIFSTQDNSIETAGLVSSVLFFGHFILARGNRQSRHVLWKALSAATTASLASAWLASMATLFIKYQRNYPQASLSDAMPNFSNRLASIRKFLSLPPGYVESLVRLLAQKARDSKWQGAIAALVMLYWGHRRRQQRNVAAS